MNKTKQSKSHQCPINNALTYHLKDTDIVEYYKVDERGYIRPNKRGWIRSKATVILGKHDVKDQSIYIPEGCLKWECEVLNNAYVSSISSNYSGQDVTLIIHT